MPKQEYPLYEDLVQQHQAGNISDYDFVVMQSDEMTAEYEQFCKDEGLVPKHNASARAFMDYLEALFEESVSL